MDFTKVMGMKVKDSSTRAGVIRPLITSTLNALPEGGAFRLIDLRDEVLRRFNPEITKPKQQSYVRINHVLSHPKFKHITKCENSNGYVFLVNGDSQTLLETQTMKVYELTYGSEGEAVFTEFGAEKSEEETITSEDVGKLTVGSLEE